METIEIPTHSSSDMDTEAEVTRAIYSLDNVRPTRSEVVISATRGQVLLTGYVPTEMIATEAVPGVVGVSNQLVDDTSLTRRVAEALATDSRTRAIPPGYQVTSTVGYVTVVAEGFDEAQRAETTEVCQSVTGVRGVKVKVLS